MKHRAQPRTKPFRHFMTALLLAAFALTGCEDGLVGQDAAEQTAFTAAPREGKLRHAHLLQRQDEGGARKVLERYADLITETEFIVGLSSSGVLSMSAVLERYTGMDGVTVKRTFNKVYKGFAVSVKKNQVDTFLNVIELDPDIEWAEPDANIQANQSSNGRTHETQQRLPSSVKDSGGHHSSTKSGDGQGSVNADLYILDSGVANEDLNVVEARSFLGDRRGEAGKDEVGHGTHVASSAAAIDDGDGLVGIAPGARIHDLKVLDTKGQTDLSTVIAAVDYVTEQKEADPSRPIVANLSFGADVGTTEYNALDKAIAASIAKGVVYVIAAGNEGIDAETVTPAHVAEAITVGAHTIKKHLASFSNYGALVDILASGEKVEGLEPQQLSAVRMDGTSMAAPHVAGAAALYLSQNPAASPQQVRDALVGAGGKLRKGQNGTTDRTLDVSSF